MINGIRRTGPLDPINVGILQDIPHSNIILGARDEGILRGGMLEMVGLSGKGNSFKTTIAMHFILSMVNNTQHRTDGMLHIYDTETTTPIDRITSLSTMFSNIDSDKLWDEDHPIATIATGADYPGEEWTAMVANALEKKKADKSNYAVSEHKKKGKPELLPSFILLDSLSEMDTKIVRTMLTEENLDDKKLHMMSMTLGAFKTKLLSLLSHLLVTTNTRLILTAHLDKAIHMATSPADRPTKITQHLKLGDKIKNVGSKFLFLPNVVYETGSPTNLINSSTKLPEYPLDGNDTRCDLVVVKLSTIRNKNGKSGHITKILISQDEGVLPSLTEFVYLKDNKFGIGGNLMNYHLTILPDINLSRTTLRAKINSNPQLRKAVKLTADIKQLITHKYSDIKTLINNNSIDLNKDSVIDDMYKLINDKGYSWDVLLNTRDYVLTEQYNKRFLPYMYAIDLFRIAFTDYIPYWLDKDKKVKNEWAKHYNVKENKNG